MLNCDGKLKLKFGAVLCFNTVLLGCNLRYGRIVLFLVSFNT